MIKREMLYKAGGISIKDFLVKSGLASSNSEAKRLLRAGAVYYRGKNQTENIREKLEIDDFIGDGTIIQVGHRFCRARFPDAPVSKLEIEEGENGETIICCMPWLP